MILSRKLHFLCALSSGHIELSRSAKRGSWASPYARIPKPVADERSRRKQCFRSTSLGLSPLIRNAFFSYILTTARNSWCHHIALAAIIPYFLLFLAARWGRPSPGRAARPIRACPPVKYRLARPSSTGLPARPIRLEIRIGSKSTPIRSQKLKCGQSCTEKVPLYARMGVRLIQPTKNII